MARRRQKKEEPVILAALVALLAYTIIFIVSILKFVYNVISFYISGYKKKSGNGFFKTFFNKGNWGEFVLYRRVIKYFPKQFVFTNIYLDNINTDKTEVDVMAISNKGIYVFEMKNYRGWIYGNEKDREWTQVFNRWSKFRFYNPLRQNYAHSKAVEKYLNIPHENLIPLIVFSNRSKLKKIKITGNNNVIQMKGLRRFIRNTERNKDEIFTNDEMMKLAEQFVLVENVSQEIKDRHIEQIQELIAKQNQV